jgi:hypothetical protein
LPVFAPVGVVGAMGWTLVYVVTGGTFSIGLFKKFYQSWKIAKADGREKIDRKLVDLKMARDDGIITEEEYRQRAKLILDDLLK